MFLTAAFAAIDWHDFVVVETIVFNEDEKGEYEHCTVPSVTCYQGEWVEAGVQWSICRRRLPLIVWIAHGKHGLISSEW